MKETNKQYDLTVGLEIHIQLNTQSKLFAADKNRFGDPSNTNVSPITLAHPGTLPLPNKSALEKAMLMGLACHCEIARWTTFDRKNYFYPDLPKGYQTTQNEHPICRGGYVDIKNGKTTKRMALQRIHIEEDAGKSSHRADRDSLLDYNRAGMPLIELVTAPEITSPEEAGSLLAEVRKLVRYTQVGDGNMEQGALRCDVNISVRPAGQKALGTRVEVKNMNSIRNVQRAIQYERKRQSDLLNRGQKVQQETRGFHDATGETIGQRIKEQANDYRYFPCPDLLPIPISEAWIDRLKASLPKLPQQIVHELKNHFGLPDHDAEIIAESKEMADYFFDTCQLCPQAKSVANWIIGPIKSHLNETGKSLADFSISPAQLSELIGLVNEGQLSFSMASNRLLPQWISKPQTSALQLAKALQLMQESDESALTPIIEEVLASMPDQVAAYKKGKKGLLGMFMGQVMKKSQGKANPKIANQLVIERLEQW